LAPAVATHLKPPARRERPVSKGKTVLMAKNVTVRYGALIAVRDFSLTLRTGTIVGLIGANGAGKSSLVNGLTGTVRASEGRIILNGEDVTKISSYQRARLGLSRTFQNTALIDELTVIDSVRLSRSKGEYRHVLGKEDETIVFEVIDACGLSELADRKVAELSYMHRRLTAIAMALVMDPTVVFLDEATAGLTAEERGQIASVITGVARGWGTAFLVIEHDVEFVASIADHIVVMESGRFLAEGSASEVLRAPEVIASYLGSNWNVAQDQPA
jgi:branched-chain amino acid transport system ATP-binding protein